MKYEFTISIIHMQIRNTLWSVVLLFVITIIPSVEPDKNDTNDYIQNSFRHYNIRVNNSIILYSSSNNFVFCFYNFSSVTTSSYLYVKEFQAN